MIGTSLPFRFDAARHDYIELSTGVVLPHITGLLLRAGLVDDRWFTEEGRDRGTAVHKLTADYDLEALRLEDCVSSYRGYLVAHVAAMAIVRPTILEVEQASVHPAHRFGGRIDRVALAYGLRAVLEIKTGDPEKAHGIQTALQAILDSVASGIPAESTGRFVLYLKGTGKFKLEEHVNRRDFAEARRIIRTYCDR